jgi:SAM-dependent methyltransferase
MAADGTTRSVRWAGRAYAEHSGHHRSVDDWFLAGHPPSDRDTVVDLGCGSGEFTAKVAGLVPGGRVVGVEPDPSMLEVARRHTAPNLTFVQASGERVDDVVDAGTADLVVSRAMLHWLPQDRHPRLFEAIRTVLRPGGVVHVEGAAPGNIPRIVPLLREVAERHRIPVPPPFPDPGIELEVVEAAGLEVADEGVRTVAQRRSFSREELVGLLRSQAALVLTRHLPVDAAGAVVDEVVDGVDRLRRHDGTYDQTFVRLEVLARRAA